MSMSMSMSSPDVVDGSSQDAHTDTATDPPQRAMLDTMNDSGRLNFRTFFMDLTAKVFFMVASICYVIVAVVGLDHELKGTKFMMLSLFAAFLFAVVGVIDMIILPRIMGAIMILAGVFGILCVAIKDSFASKVLNSVSVHLFFIEAMFQFVFQKNETGILRIYLRFGDVFWLVGSLTDVILSYTSLEGVYTVVDARAAVFSASLWLACSLVYVSAAVFVRVTTNEDIVYDLEMKEDVSHKDEPTPESKIV